MQMTESAVLFQLIFQTTNTVFFSFMIYDKLN